MPEDLRYPFPYDDEPTADQLRGQEGYCLVCVDPMDEPPEQDKLEVCSSCMDDIAGFSYTHALGEEFLQANPSENEDFWLEYIYKGAFTAQDKIELIKHGLPEDDYKFFLKQFCLDPFAEYTEWLRAAKQDIIAKAVEVWTGWTG